MKCHFVVHLCSILVFSAAVIGQDKLPQPDPGNVTLTLDEFNRLWELASRPQKHPDPPPLNYSLKRAELKFKVDDESVSGTVLLQGEILKKGVVKVPLVTGMTILDAHQEGKSIPLQLENGTQTAVLQGSSEFSVTLDAAMPLRIDAGRASVTFPVPLAGSTTLTLTIPGDHTAVSISPGLITNRTSENGRTTIEATLVPGQHANLWWATRENAAPAVAREVRFLADVKTLVSVGEAELSLAALTDVTVVQGEPAQFELEIPAGYEVTGVTGASLESNDVEQGILLLRVTSAGQRNHQFLITMERSLATSSKTDVPFLNFKNVQRETGEVLVEGAGTLELTATEGGALKRMDVKEANPYLRSLAHFPPQAAFRYHRQPGETPTLALEWVRFPDSSVLAAVAESAVVTTMVTSEGKSLTEVRLLIKNQAQPFLKVALPVGAILSADVAGQKVKPVEGADGSRVPLLRAGFRPTDLYEVSFVFLHSGTPFAKKGGSELSLPPMDVPINVVRWEVFLPERYKVKDFGGDVLAADLVPAADLMATGRTGNFTFSATGVKAIGGPMRGDFNLNLSLPGQLGGMVTDPSGAVVANAQVTVTSAETGANMSALTNPEGLWQVFGVPSGQLRVRVEAPGFKTAAQTASYDASRPGAVNTTLSIGAASESIEVTSESAAVNGRNVMELERLESNAKKQAQAAQNAPSLNVFNLQRRVAGVLPVAVDVPRAGTAFHFVRPLVVDEETKVTFVYKTKS